MEQTKKGRKKGRKEKERKKERKKGRTKEYEYNVAKALALPA
jgi:hypothetical protein